MKVIDTSRGEQLVQRHWEETAMRISCRHYDQFLIRWKTSIVQCSYAYAATYPKRLPDLLVALRRRGLRSFRVLDLGRECCIDVPELSALFGKFVGESKAASQA